MNAGTVALVLVAATAHALWNIASKYKREDTYLFVWAYSCASALLCVPIGIALMVMGEQVLDWRFVVGCAVSATLHIAYSLILQAGYQRAELGVVYSVARGTGPMLTRRRHRIPAVLRADAVPILIVAVLSPLAYVLVLTAMLSAPVALVAPLRESSIVIGSFLAYWLFREGNLTRRVTGAVIVLAGIVAISL